MAKRHKGKIVIWKDDKGYGFIESANGRDRVFFHIRHLADRQRRPELNTSVTYVLDNDDKGRVQAIDVRFGNEPVSLVVVTLLVSGSFFAALALITFIGGISPLLLILYALFSSITFIAYEFDKINARQGRRRISERSLHLLELLGGWPGALVAQWYLSHKNRKASYQRVFWLVVFVNLGVLFWYCYQVLT